VISDQDEAAGFKSSYLGWPAGTLLGGRLRSRPLPCVVWHRDLRTHPCTAVL